MGPWETWSLCVAFGYGALSIATAARIIAKLNEAGTSYIRRSRYSFLLMLMTSMYAVVRCTELIVVYTGYVSLDEDKADHYFTSLPSMFLAAMQAAFVAKWVTSLRDLVAAMNLPTFRGTWALVTTTLCALAVCVVTLLGVIDTSTHFIGVSTRTWNNILSILCSLIFFFNGAVFLGYGLRLGCLWRTAALSHTKAVRGTFALALVFGIMCGVRGFFLFLYSMSQWHSTDKVTRQSWSAPAIYSYEWLSVCTSIALLTSISNALHGDSSADSEDGVQHNDSLLQPQYRVRRISGQNTPQRSLTPRGNTPRGSTPRTNSMRASVDVTAARRADSSLAVRGTSYTASSSYGTATSSSMSTIRSSLSPSASHGRYSAGSSINALPSSDPPLDVTPSSSLPV